MLGYICKCWRVYVILLIQVYITNKDNIYVVLMKLITYIIQNHTYTHTLFKIKMWLPVKYFILFFFKTYLFIYHFFKDLFILFFKTYLFIYHFLRPIYLFIIF